MIHKKTAGVNPSSRDTVYMFIISATNTRQEGTSASLPYFHGPEGQDMIVMILQSAML